jgi:hypothetical protein
MSNRKIENILKKYPCDENGIFIAGIDFLRFDLQKAFGQTNPIAKKGRRKPLTQCMFEKTDGEGGVKYCVLDVGHREKEHKFYE